MWCQEVPIYEELLELLSLSSISCREGDKLVPSVQKKINELEVGLLHLQQNIDIPEISLTIHPTIATSVKRATEGGKKLTVEELGSLVSDSSFLNALQKDVSRWIREIQKVRLSSMQHCFMVIQVIQLHYCCLLQQRRYCCHCGVPLMSQSLTVCMSPFIVHPLLLLHACSIYCPPLIINAHPLYLLLTHCTEGNSSGERCLEWHCSSGDQFLDEPGACTGQDTLTQAQLRGSADSRRAQGWEEISCHCQL